jgi:hypothetical protein
MVERDKFRQCATNEISRLIGRPSVSRVAAALNAKNGRADFATAN